MLSKYDIIYCEESQIQGSRECGSFQVISDFSKEENAK